MKLKSTPIIKYENIFVKREDLCAPPGGPPFSKIRGLIPHLQGLKNQGVKGIAYVETSISMAGWGIAWACSELGMKCLIFNPIYKEPLPLLIFHRKMWNKYGAELIDIPAGRAKVNYYQAFKLLPEGYHLLSLGIPLEETVQETYEEAKKSQIYKYPSVIVCVGSGTIAAGVLKSLKFGQTLYGVMTRSGNIIKKREQIIKKSKSIKNTGFFQSSAQLRIIDSDWEYASPSNVFAPFPCHPYYDKKAWEWLQKNKNQLEKPILFWNIGSTIFGGKS